MTHKNRNNHAEDTAMQRSATREMSDQNAAAGTATPETYFTPLMDIAETGDSYLIQADMPGINPADLDVSFHDGVLTLQATAASRQSNDQRYLWQEYGVGRFYRTLNLGNRINPDGIHAELKDGVLSVYIPKAESAKARKIEVRSS